MSNTVKILLAYHKKAPLFKDDVLTPIHVGRSLARENGREESVQWLMDNMVGDDTGENISQKNSSYNELTALYWAWKNYSLLGNPEYIGLMHYRRHFFFNGEKRLRAVYDQFDEGRMDEYLDEIGYNEENVQKIVDGYDLICPKPYRRATIYSNYVQNHPFLSLDTAVDIIKERYPEYTSACDKYLAGSDAFLFNMFIMKRDLFFQYARWLFDILTEYEKREDITGKRLFLSERLTGIFFQHLIDHRYKVNQLATMFIEEEHKVPVMFATDNNYSAPTIVALISMLRNARQHTIYDVYIAVPADFTEENKNKINKLTEYYKRCEITFLTIHDEFQNAHIVNKRITSPTYYRLLAGSLLPEYDKCLYLDSDIIVERDLTELYDLMMEDDYIAGVKAPAYHFPLDGNQRYLKRSGLESIDQYVNAGVLLLNLKKFRELDLERQFIELASRDFPSQDQDILNMLCYDHIRHIHFKFNNMMPKYMSERDDLHRVFGKKMIDEAIATPFIIHYCDKQKPWDDLLCAYAERWWQYGSALGQYDEGAFNEYIELSLDSFHNWQGQLDEIGKAQQEEKKLRETLAKKKNQLSTLKKKLEGTKKKVKALNDETRKVKESFSFLLGTIVAFAPRRIKNMRRAK